VPLTCFCSSTLCDWSSFLIFGAAHWYILLVQSALPLLRVLHAAVHLLGRWKSLDTYL
jgi:hypothetical protein